MQLNIKGTNLEVTQSVHEYVNKKVEDLAHFFSDNLENAKIFVEIGRTTQHHNKGDVFRAEITIKVGGEPIRAEATAGEWHAAFDLAKEEMSLKVVKFKNKKDTLYKKGVRVLKNLIHLSSEEE
ncbi:MAG: hypothetical protein UT37_C0013G0013 [Parcubacteria group bacterium GW2011_GWA2_39_18]|nr:MAG: hypothetical protein UT37_C0013G0013 [Parcubacteria group bacterium GW2011_GWA2_39_18]